MVFSNLTNDHFGTWQVWRLIQQPSNWKSSWLYPKLHSHPSLALPWANGEFMKGKKENKTSLCLALNINGATCEERITISHCLTLCGLADYSLVVMHDRVEVVGSSQVVSLLLPEIVFLLCPGVKNRDNIKYRNREKHKDRTSA